MPDAVFEIAANITPTIDAAAAQREADRLATLVQSRLAQKAGKISASFDGGAAAKQVQVVGKAQDQLAQKIKKTNTEAAKSGGSLAGPLKALGKAAGSATSPISALTGALGGLGGSMSGVQAAITATIAAFVAFNTFGITAAVQLETLGTALRGLFGDQAKQAFVDLNRFASQTPFSLQSATSAVIKLSSAFEGLDPAQSIALLKPFASAAAAIGAGEDAISRATTAISQIGAQGKVTADNLRQVSEALPNVSKTAVIRQLAQDLKITESAASSMLLNGLVPAADGIKAIAGAAQNARGSSDALARQAATLSGRISTLKDNVTVLMGIGFAPFIKGLSVFVAGLNEHFKLALKAVGAVAQAGSHLPRVGVRFAEMKEQIDAASASLEAAGGAATDAIPNVDRLALAMTGLQNASGFSGQLSALSGVFSAFNAKADETAKAQGEALDKTLALGPAIEALSNAHKGAKDAQSALNDAIERHNQELADERVQLTEAATAATNRLTEAQAGLVDATEALRLAQEGASADELERKDIALAEAKLKLLQLDEDAKVALDALNASQDALNESQKESLGLHRASVDLTGMSVDQIKSRLSTVRASLKAQQDTNKDTKKTAKTTDETGKSAQQIAIDAHQAELDRRTAVLDVRAAEEAVLATKQQGSALDEAVISAQKAVLQATRERDSAMRNQQNAQAALNDLGKVDREYQREITRLTEARKEAQGKIAESELALQTARATALGDQGLINQLKLKEIEHNSTLLAQMAALRPGAPSSSAPGAPGAPGANTGGLNQPFLPLGVAQDPFSKLFPDGAPGTSRTITLTKGEWVAKLPLLLQQARTLSDGKLVVVTQALLDQIGKQILEDPSGDFRETLRRILSSLGLTIPGLKTGGLVEGVPGPVGTLRRLGEYGRSELVLPLSNAARSADLLARYAPTISLAGAQKAGAQTGLPLSLSPSLASLPPGTRLSPGTRQSGPSEPQARKEREALAEAIVSRMAAAGFNEKGGDNHFAINVEAGPNAQLSERAVMRAIERALDR